MTHKPKRGTLAEVSLTEQKIKRTRKPGAGRPPLPTTCLLKRRTIRLNDTLWEYCKAQGDASEFLRGLAEKHKGDKAT